VTEIMQRLQNLGRHGKGEKELQTLECPLLEFERSEGSGEVERIKWTIILSGSGFQVGNSTAEVRLQMQSRSIT